MRISSIKLARDYNWRNGVQIINDNFIQNVLSGLNGFKGTEKILIETAQGFDLDINHGLEYPHVTFRQCTPAQALADCGIPHNISTESYMVIRPYPIRINNNSDVGRIYTGNYDGSPEITWEEIEKRSGCTGLLEKELSTITKRPRRVFEFSYDRFKRALALTNPDYVIVNFAQYIDSEVSGKNDSIKNYSKVNKFVESLIKNTGVKIPLLGTGAKLSEVIHIRH